MKWFAQFIVIFILWLLLTWSVDIEEIFAGIIVSLIATMVTKSIFLNHPFQIFNPIRIFWLLVYIPYMFYQIFIANLDVAYRVLHPELPINPGIVKFKTTLKSPFAKTALANSITLTPGTFTVDYVDDMMYIHWINVKGKNEDDWYKEIAGKFEGILRRIFE